MRGGAKLRLAEALGGLNTDLCKFWMYPKEDVSQTCYTSDTKLI